MIEENILIRQDLDDEGVRERSWGCTPDIIVYEQVLNPRRTFSGEHYYTDIHYAIDDENLNFIYVRVKNISESPIKRIYISLYASYESTYKELRTWEEDRVRSIGGNNYVEIINLQPGEIAAADDYFVFDYKKYKNSDFIAIASDKKDIDFSPIDTTLALYQWMQKVTNIAVRTIGEFGHMYIHAFEQLIHISNPFNTKSVMRLHVYASGLIPDTEYVIKSDAIKFIKKMRYSVQDGSQVEKVFDMELPPNFNNYLLLYAILPQETECWPAKAIVWIKVGGVLPSAHSELGLDETIDGGRSNE